MHRRSPLFLLIHRLYQCGVRNVFVCPGSRSAPLTLSFNRHKGFRLHVVVDERSAAYQAMGIAMQQQAPVVILCTSGTAAVNFYPAVTESFYLEVPLIVLTADRPSSAIDQQDGQAIRQKGLFHNHIQLEYSFPEEEGQAGMAAAEAICHLIATKLHHPKQGPMHINIPFSEPLYDIPELLPSLNELIADEEIDAFHHPIKEDEKVLLPPIPEGAKILVLLGYEWRPREIGNLLRLANHSSVVIIAEALSNAIHPTFIHLPEAILAIPEKHEYSNLQADILITTGLGVVSKRIKGFLRQYAPSQHWHISPSGQEVNTYGVLTHTFTDEQAVFEALLQQLPEPTINSSTDFKPLWHRLQEKAADVVAASLGYDQWSELKSIGYIMSELPKNTRLHLSNSMPVRLGIQFAPSYRSDIKYFANRGTSGIDGCVSTAIGFARGDSHQNILISGDLSFLYDQNGLWSIDRSHMLKIIISNNGGGNIFRLIDGPSSVPELDRLFYTPQNVSIAHLCSAYDIPYFCARDEETLQRLFPIFLRHPGMCILELPSQPADNRHAFTQYKNALKQIR
jgi:2-succinyl-5-enolpyruvyl-6-hydroxy-3-cyclohexene-1-carboxylate synthase